MCLWGFVNCASLRLLDMTRNAPHFWTFSLGSKGGGDTQQTDNLLRSADGLTELLHYKWRAAQNFSEQREHAEQRLAEPKSITATPSVF